MAPTEDAIIKACERGDIELLRRWGRQQIRVSSAEPLCRAIFEGRVDMVHCLVNELGADVNQAIEEGDTPVFVAVFWGNVALVRWLVEDHGANVNQRCPAGDSLVHIAAEHSNLEMLRILKELGADLKQASQDGFTPMHVSAQHGNCSVVRLLAELGADVNHPKLDGITPMQVAARNGQLEMIRCLGIELGADVNKAGLDGITPLYIAAARGDHAMVRLLAEELNADVNKAKSDGRTPLMAVSTFQHKLVGSAQQHAKVIKCLIRNGADVKAVMSTDDAVGTAADVSRIVGAPAEQTAYLEAKTHCSRPGCNGAGVKKCAGCKLVWYSYCGKECQVAHWPAHKADCKAHRAKAGKVM
jgi:ankyrin repeat protein